MLRLSQSRRLLAPLAFLVGGVVLLFQGFRLVVFNWRLTLVQVLPAMWIWLAMLDLKIHVLHGQQLSRDPRCGAHPHWMAIIGLTMASLFLNAVFAFAIPAPAGPTSARR